MQPEMPFVAPARYLLTVLHRQEAGSGPGEDPEGEPVTGWTACGEPMRAAELWQPVDGRDGDLLCTGCMLPGSAESAESAAEDAAGVLF